MDDSNGQECCWTVSWGFELVSAGWKGQVERLLAATGELFGGQFRFKLGY